MICMCSNHSVVNNPQKRINYSIIYFNINKYCQNIKQWTDLLLVCLTAYQVDHYIGDNSHRDTFRNTVHERHCNDTDVCRNGLGIIIKVNLQDRWRSLKILLRSAPVRLQRTESQGRSVIRTETVQKGLLLPQRSVRFFRLLLHQKHFLRK